MVYAENQKKEMMYAEAAERMELLGIDEEFCRLFLTGGELIKKATVDHDKKLVGYAEVKEEECRMIQEWEKEKNSIVYYVIQDEGIWPDGCRFPRYILLYVDSYAEEYEMIKENCIRKAGTVPAYVINMEEPECSEYAECSFQNVTGILVSLS